LGNRKKKAGVGKSAHEKSPRKKTRALLYGQGGEAEKKWLSGGERTKKKPVQSEKDVVHRKGEDRGIPGKITPQTYRWGRFVKTQEKKKKANKISKFIGVKKRGAAEGDKAEWLGSPIKGESFME